MYTYKYTENEYLYVEECVCICGSQRHTCKNIRICITIFNVQQDRIYNRIKAKSVYVV